MTEIDGVDIHFIHVRSPHEDALPLIMTHGWPGSVVELLESVGPLTDPTAHGGRAEDAFDLVLPSLPGYGFSGEPAELGWDARPHRAGLGRADAPPRLHPLRRPGRRRGRRRHRRDGSPGARGAGRHPHQPARDGAGRGPAAGGHRARNARRPRARRRSGRAASATSWSRPRGRRRSATPCWTRPSPWRPGCSTTTPTAYYKIAARLRRRAARRQPHPGPHPRQHHALLADRHRRLGGPVVLGELRAAALAAAGQAPPPTSGPGRLHDVPRRDLARPRAAGSRRAYPTLTYFHEVDRGGHFAAWEEPELFSTEIRAAFRSLR